MTNKVLSVFIDESGDFGSYESHSPYYIVSMILHQQTNDISDHIHLFNTHLDHSNYPSHAIHAGPLIRRESIYKKDLIEERKYLFNSLFHFARKLNFKYICIKIKKKECNGLMDIVGKELFENHKEKNASIIYQISYS